MRTRHILLLSGTAMFFLIAAAGVISGQKNASGKTARAEDPDDLRITFGIPKSVYKVGELIPLKVEFYNRSKHSILLTKQIPGVNVEGSPVSVDVSVVSAVRRESWVSAQTLHPSPLPGLNDSVAMLDWWVLLEPRQFYGSTLIIDPSGFGLLGKPGMYKLRVELTSYGGYPPTIANRVASTEPNVPNIPYPVWSGTAKWESGWLQITK